MKLWKEEVFGLVAVIEKYPDFKDAIGDRFLSQGCKELGYSPAKRIKKKGELRRFQGRALPSGLESNMSELLKGIGISCFSEARDSILMWAHYAAEHSGVVLGLILQSTFFRPHGKFSTKMRFRSSTGQAIARTPCYRSHYSQSPYIGSTNASGGWFDAQ